MGWMSDIISYHMWWVIPIVGGSDSLEKSPQVKEVTARNDWLAEITCAVYSHYRKDLHTRPYIVTKY